MNEKVEEVKKELISIDAIKEQFSEFIEQANEVYEKCKVIVVTDQNTHAIAERTLKDASNILKAIDEGRKGMKEPYVRTGKNIEAVAKELKTPVKNGVELLKKEILKYQEKAAEDMVKVSDEKIIGELDDLKDTDASNDELFRLQQQMISRLYGGVYTTKTGEGKKVPGCWTNEEVTAFTEIVQDFPSKQFTNRIKLRCDKFLELMTSHINMRLTYIRNAGIPGNDVDELLQGQGHNAVKLREIILKEYDHEKKSIEKTEKTIGKEYKEKLKDIEKGIRKVWRFKVLNLEMVPKDFIQINESAVNDYVKANSESIEKGGSGIPGIQFYQEKIKVVRS